MDLPYLIKSELIKCDLETLVILGRCSLDMYKFFRSELTKKKYLTERQMIQIDYYQTIRNIIMLTKESHPTSKKDAKVNLNELPYSPQIGEIMLYEFDWFKRFVISPLTKKIEIVDDEHSIFVYRFEKNADFVRNIKFTGIGKYKFTMRYDNTYLFQDSDILPANILTPFLKLNSYHNLYLDIYNISNEPVRGLLCFDNGFLDSTINAQNVEKSAFLASDISLVSHYVESYYGLRNAYTKFGDKERRMLNSLTKAYSSNLDFMIKVYGVFEKGYFIGYRRG